MICNNCGNKLDDNNKLCTKCGKKVLVKTVKKKVVKKELENKMLEKEKNVKPIQRDSNVSKKNGLRTASIILGIIGLAGIALIIFAPVSGIISLIGLILGFVSLKKGRNVLGILLNSIGLVLSILVTILMVFTFNYVLEAMGIKYDNGVFIGRDVVATVSGDNITVNELNDMYGENYSVSVLLNRIDDVILSEKYPSNKTMKKWVEDMAEYYYDTYESYYGYSKKEFLNYYGYDSEEKFLELLTLDYRRNLYFDEYVRNMITDKEIDKFYDKEVYGDIDSKHILVQISEDGYSKEDAFEKALEIINKLNSGYSFDDVVAYYKNDIVYENLGYMAFNASLESAYLDECRDLDVGEYSKIPVLTSYGYHIVYKIDQKDKPKYSSVKEDIIDVLIQEKKKNDENLYNKSLMYMREDAGVKIYDEELSLEYEEFIDMFK